MRTALATIAACPKVTNLRLTAACLPGDTLLQLARPYAKQLTTLDVSETYDLSASYSNARGSARPWRRSTCVTRTWRTI